jgi:hypothetical protein
VMTHGLGALDKGLGALDKGFRGLMTHKFSNLLLALFRKLFLELE